MPGDPFQRVAAGQKVRLQAATHNAFLDAALAHRARQHDVHVNPLREPLPPGMVRVQNASGEARDRFDVLGIDGVVITPSANEDEFTGRVLLKGVEPADPDHFGAFVILAEPLGNEEVGRAYADGLCPVRIRGTGTHADVDAGEYGWLQARVYGHARIVWQEAGSDERWAIVRLNDPQLTVIGRTEAPWLKDNAGAVAVRTIVAGVEQSAGYTVSPVINRFGTIDPFARVWCAWTDGAWHLVSAECQVTTTTTSTSTTTSTTSTTSTSTTSTTTTSTTTTSTTTTSTTTSTTTTTAECIQWDCCTIDMVGLACLPPTLNFELDGSFGMEFTCACVTGISGEMVGDPDLDQYATGLFAVGCDGSATRFRLKCESGKVQLETLSGAGNDPDWNITPAILSIVSCVPLHLQGNVSLKGGPTGSCTSGTFNIEITE